MSAPLSESPAALLVLLVLLHVVIRPITVVPSIIVTILMPRLSGMLRISASAVVMMMSPLRRGVPSLQSQLLLIFIHDDCCHYGLRLIENSGRIGRFELRSVLAVGSDIEIGGLASADDCPLINL